MAILELIVGMAGIDPDGGKEYNPSNKQNQHRHTMAKQTKGFSLSASPRSQKLSPPTKYNIIKASVVITSLALLLITKVWRHKSSAGVQTSDLDLIQLSDKSKSIMPFKFVEVPSGREDVKRYAAVDGSATNEHTNRPVSIKTWMTAVSSDSPQGIQAALDLTNIIATSSYASILFETPGTNWRSSNDHPFEVALVNEPALQRFAENHPDRDAFEEHFNACLMNNHNKMNTNPPPPPTICSFANLGGDAQLISPLPQTNVNDSSYSHLAAFLRRAPKPQVATFWKMASTEYLNVLQQKHEYDKNTSKTWFSTNGMGVAWVHLRLDTRPKYYSYGPFTREGSH